MYCSIVRDGASYFLRPRSAGQRRYEAVRAYLVEEAAAREAGQRFHVAPRSVEVWADRLRRGDLDLFQLRAPGPEPMPAAPALRDAVLELRRSGMDVYGISRALPQRGLRASHSKVWQILKEAGVGRLPKRSRAAAAPSKAVGSVADVARLDLSVGRVLACRAPLLFLFAPLLARLDLEGHAREAGLPGSSMIPRSASLRSLLALKLASRGRISHVLGVADDEGLGLWAGLNVLPKTTALSTYSYRVGSDPMGALQSSWVAAYGRLEAFPSASFNLDFHTIRHYGDAQASRLEKNYVPRRSQSVPSVLAAFAQEHASHTLVYANADLLKREGKDEVVRFVEYWESTTGKRPKELVFDAKATTHAGLAKLDALGVTFLTLRERRPKEVQRVQALPEKAWTRITLDAPDRKWRRPRVVDERVRIDGYPKAIRQLAALDLGREEPTLLLTNDTRRGPAKLLGRYVKRALIENSIAEQVGFFHVDALSSDVRLKVSLDVVLSVFGSNCYHWLARRLKGYESATAATLWRDFLDRPGSIRLTQDEVVLRVRRFSRAPILLDSEAVRDPTTIPWLGNRRIRLELT